MVNMCAQTPIEANSPSNRGRGGAVNLAGLFPFSFTPLLLTLCSHPRIKDLKVALLVGHGGIEQTFFTQ